MSANTLYTLDQANMFCGTQPGDQSASLHLKLTEVKIPTLDEQYVEHRPGGAPVEIQIDMIYAHFECTFQIVGMDPQVFRLIRPVEDNDMYFYIYGLIADQLITNRSSITSGGYIQAAAVIKGRLASLEPEPYNPGTLFHTNCAIKGITYFKFSLANTPLWEWDFFSNYFVKGPRRAA